MTSPHPFSKPLLIRQVGAVAQVALTVVPDEILRRRNLVLTEQNTSVKLPTSFYMGDAWQLTHASPTTGESVCWNWDYQPWFRDGAGLSTYALRDPELVAILASVFSGLTATQAISPQGTYTDYVLASTIDASLPAVVPRLLFYTNLTGTEQYLALYSLHYASPAEGPTGVNTVAVYEIVQIEVNALELHAQLLQAQQTAVHDNHQRWG